jgi:hypothetical protein
MSGSLRRVQSKNLNFEFFSFPATAWMDGWIDGWMDGWIANAKTNMFSRLRILHASGCVGSQAPPLASGR